MRYLVSKAKGKLRIGDWVKTNGDGKWSMSRAFEGEIGEIADYAFFVWQNRKKGGSGKLDPLSRGYKYSWAVYWKQSEGKQGAYIEIHLS